MIKAQLGSDTVVTLKKTSQGMKEVVLTVKCISSEK